MKKTAQSPRYISPMIPVMVLFLMLLCLLASCELQSLAPGQETTNDANTVYQPIEVTTTDPGETTTIQQTTTAPPTTTTTAPILYFNPLTGLPCEGPASSCRPIAFTVKEANGIEISSADLVIEAPTEANNTRLALVGVSHTEIMASIELASTRPYLADLCNDLFAISVYHGTSDREKESTAFLYDTIDTKTAPMESTTSALKIAITAAGYQQSIAGNIALPYTLEKIGSTVKPQKLVSTYISIPYSDTTASAFTYDTLANAYTMRTCTALLQDGTLPTFTNIIILFYDATLRVSKDGSTLTLDTDLGGSGYYVTQGGAMPILWRRDTETSRLIITDENDIPLTINRGKTYIGMTTFAQRNQLILN